MLKTNIEKLAVLKGLDKLIAYQDKTIREHQHNLVRVQKSQREALLKLEKYRNAIEYLAEHAANPNDRQIAKRQLMDAEELVA